MPCGPRGSDVILPNGQIRAFFLPPAVAFDFDFRFARQYLRRADPIPEIQTQFQFRFLIWHYCF